MAAFPCTHSFLHSSSHTTQTSPAVFQGPAHASQGGKPVTLWPFPMLLSLPLRLAHFVRGHVYSKVYSKPLSLSGPLLPVGSVCPCSTQPTHTHTLCFLLQIWLGAQETWSCRGAALAGHPYWLYPCSPAPTSSTSRGWGWSWGGLSSLPPAG